MTDQPRDRVLSVRLTGAEYEALRRRGGRVSDIIRGLISRDLELLPEGTTFGNEVPMWWGEFWVGQTYPKVATS